MMMEKNDCIFCKIVNKEIPSSIVYEDENTIAFLDIAPANKGHILVIPKSHYSDITTIPENELQNVFSTVKEISQVLFKEYEGVNLLQNNGKVAGQLVNHFHVHLIPRKENDGLSLGEWDCKKYEPGEMQEYQEKIKNFLNKD